MTTGYGKILNVLHGLDSTAVFAGLNELEKHIFKTIILNQDFFC